MYLPINFQLYNLKENIDELKTKLNDAENINKKLTAINEHLVEQIKSFKNEKVII